jgi:hypothetical protein
VSNSAEIERQRQAIMRFRELLDLLRQSLDQGEAAYAALFASLSTELMESMAEKERQGLAAHEVISNREILSRPLLRLRLRMRALESDFEQVYDHVMAE